LNADEPQPEVKIPTPPDFLSPEGLEEWNRLAPLLFANGLIAEIYRGPFAAYCQAYGRWVQAEKELATSGTLLVKAMNGNIGPNPLESMARQNLALAIKAGVEFGLTPAAISRVHARKQDKQQGAWLKFGGKSK
jgi:P27 family predicted phage terminase small subunit